MKNDIVKTAANNNKLSMFRVEFLITATVIWAFLQYFFTRDLKVLPELFTLVDEAMLVGILFYFMAQMLQKKICIEFGGFEKVFLLLVATGVLSTLLNNNGFFNVVTGLRCFFQYVILFYALSYLNLSDKYCKRIMAVILTMVLLQIPFMVYQYFSWTPSSQVNDHADAAYGTLSFGAANILGVLLLVMLLYLIKVKNKLPLVIKTLYIVMISFGIILSHSKVTYLLIIILYLYEYRNKIFSKTGLKNILITGVAILMLLKAASYVSDDVNNLTDYNKLGVLIENQLTDKEGGGRIFYFILTIGIINKYAISPFLGLGPGMYSSYAGIQSKSRYLTDLLGLDLESRGARLDSDLTAFIGEYGYLGIFFFTLLMIILFSKSNRLGKHHGDKFWSSYASWFSLFVIVFYFGAVVNSLWQAQFFSVNFWIAAGLMNRQYLQRETV